MIGSKKEGKRELGVAEECVDGLKNGNKLNFKLTLQEHCGIQLEMVSILLKMEGWWWWFVWLVIDRKTFLKITFRG